MILYSSFLHPVLLLIAYRNDLYLKMFAVALPLIVPIRFLAVMSSDPQKTLLMRHLQLGFLSSYIPLYPFHTFLLITLVWSNISKSKVYSLFPLLPVCLSRLQNWFMFLPFAPSGEVFFMSVVRCFSCWVVFRGLSQFMITTYLF